MKWWKISNQSNDNAELLLYGSIGEDWFSDNSAKDFANALQGLKHIKNITIRINSPGGDVSAGVAIYNLIKAHQAVTTVVIDGLCASAASLVAMSGNKIIMPTCALLMIHNPMSYVAGDGSDMQHAAGVLEKVKDTMITVYADKTGKDRAVLSKMMDDETWMGAEEALKEGFIDEIDGGAAVSVVAANDAGMYIVNGLPVDFKIYKNMPVSLVSLKSNTTNNTYKEAKIMNVEQMQTEYPEIYKQIYNAGIVSERNRIKEIDSIRAAGYESIKQKAKYESFESAGKVAIDIVNAQAEKLLGTASNLTEDIFVSNVNDIPVNDAPELETTSGEATKQSLIQKAIGAANAVIKGR